MADETTAVAAGSTTGPSSPPSPAPSPTESQAPSTGATQTSEGHEAPVIDWARIGEVDPEELSKKHPKLAGKIGDLAAKQAEKKAAELKANLEREITERISREMQEKTKREQQALEDELAETDPLGLAELKKKQKAMRAAEEAAKTQGEQLQSILQKTEEGLWKKADKEIFDVLYGELPQDMQLKLSAKEYQGNVTAARLSYLRDLIDLNVNARLQAERAKWEKDAMPALKKQALSEERDTTPSPSLSSGTGTSSNAPMTADEFKRNKQDPAWMRANMPRINKALSEGFR